MLVYSANDYLLRSIQHRGCVLILREKSTPVAVGIEKILAICESSIIIDNRDFFLPPIYPIEPNELQPNTAFLLFKTISTDRFGNVFGYVRSLSEPILQAIRTKDREKLLFNRFSDDDCQAITMALASIVAKALADTTNWGETYFTSVSYLPDCIYEKMKESSFQNVNTLNPYDLDGNGDLTVNDTGEMVVEHQLPMNEISVIFAPDTLGDPIRENSMLRSPFEEIPPDTALVAVTPDDSRNDLVDIFPFPVKIGGNEYTSAVRRIVRKENKER